MPPKQLPFTTDGVIGDVPNGFYAAADSDRGMILLRTPGLDSKATLTDCTEVREIYAWDNYLYALARRGSNSILWRVDPITGSAVEIGTLTTSFTGPAWMKHNPTQLGVFDGISGWVFTRATNSFVQIADANFLGSGGFDYQDKYGISFQPDSRTWQLSNLDNFLLWSASTYTKETQPDNIVALLSFMRQPIICGAKTTEIYHNTGGTDSSGTTATFERDAGGLIMNGCGAAKSLNAMCGIAPVWLTDEGQVIQLSGYNAQPISNQMVERAIRAMTGYSDAVAFSYRDKGHIFYQITFPSANLTWVYDATTKVWHKRQSYDGNGDWGRHRANCYALLNGKHYVGDFNNGKIYEMSQDYLDDDGETIRRLIYTVELDGGQTMIFHRPIQLLMSVGIGLSGADDPQVMMQLSNDGGNTWSNEMWRSAGAIGSYQTRVMWNQPGASYRRMYCFIFTDSVEWQIHGIDF